MKLRNDCNFGVYFTFTAMKAYFNVLIPAIALVVFFTGCDQDPDPTDPIDIPDLHFEDALLEGTLDENG